MDIKQEFREEKNMDVYATNVNDGSFSNIYVKWLEAKLTFTDVVSCVCKIPEPRLKVSENGTYSYCNNCSKTYWQK
jgi:hypothetical protein